MVQLVLTGGNFTIAGIVSTQWIVSIRSKEADVDFRTIDGDKFETLIDCANGHFEITATHVRRGSNHNSTGDATASRAVGRPGYGGAGNRRAGGSAAKEKFTLIVSVTAPAHSFSAPLYVPSLQGFANNPGSV